MANFANFLNLVCAQATRAADIAELMADGIDLPVNVTRLGGIQGLTSEEEAESLYHYKWQIAAGERYSRYYFPGHPDPRC